jgi:hypothetical protein
MYIVDALTWSFGPPAPRGFSFGGGRGTLGVDARIQLGLVRDRCCGRDRPQHRVPHAPVSAKGCLHPIAAMMPIGLRRVLRARRIIRGDEDLCCFSRGPRERLEYCVAIEEPLSSRMMRGSTETSAASCSFTVGFRGPFLLCSAAPPEKCAFLHHVHLYKAVRAERTGHQDLR